MKDWGEAERENNNTKAGLKGGGGGTRAGNTINSIRWSRAQLRLWSWALFRVLAFLNLHYRLEMYEYV
jgi:hypothetical protein